MNDDRPILITRQGHPVSDNQALLSVGERGPATLENYSSSKKLRISTASAFLSG
jgi:catalase